MLVKKLMKVMQLFIIPKKSLFIHKRHPCTGNLNSETLGGSKHAFLQCGDVLGVEVHGCHLHAMHTARGWLPRCMVSVTGQGQQGTKSTTRGGNMLYDQKVTHGVGSLSSSGKVM